MSIGPVELVVIKYNGDRFTGVPAAKIQAMVDARIIRIIDVIFARKAGNGEVTILEINELEDEEAGTMRRRAHAPDAYSCASRNRSASMAAMHPVPAAVTAWRYVGSWTSPQANTPSTFVRVVFASVRM